MNTKIYLLTLLVLLCVSCENMTVNTVQTEQNVSAIDATIQQIAEKALFNQLEALDAGAGIAIVMDVATGTVKAVAKKNLSENDTVATGSLFQVPCMLVALDDNIVLPDDKIETGNGIFEFRGTTVEDHNHDMGGYGTITAGQAIMFSSNVGITKILLKGYDNNPNQLIAGLHKLGFAGIPKDKPVAAYLTLEQGIKAPAIGILQFYNSIASGTANCTPASLDAVRKMLISVVDAGTGKPQKSDKVSIAGKTGVSKVEGKRGFLNDVVSFCGYFPADNPQYSCLVIIVRPLNGAVSGALAGRVFKEIAEQINER